MNKKFFLKMLVAICMITMVVVSFTACNKIDTMGRIQENNVVIMGTNAEFPPFEYRNERGEIDGFDVAIAKAIAEELGVELKIEDMAFDALLNSLNAGRIDFVAAAVSVTEERLKNNDFSIGYYTAGQSIMIRKGDDTIQGKEDLVGKIVGVQQGTTGDLEASDIEGVGEVRRYMKALDAVMDLKAGRINAVVVDESPAEIFVRRNDDLMILEERLTDEEYAIAVRKGDKELVEAINRAIQDLKDSGRYDAYYDQYISDFVNE